MIGDALKGLPSLSCLNGFEWFKSIIAGGLTQFKFVEPSRDSWKMLFDRHDEVAVLSLFLDRSRSTLTSLNLHNIPLCTNGAAWVAKVLAELTNLKSLDLGRNFMGDAGATSLTQAISRLTYLQTLNSQNNQIGHKGWKMLGNTAKALRVLGNND